MWEYRARPLGTHDGDTITLELDLGLSVRAEVNVRLLDVHAPELSEPGGREAAAYVADWLSRLDKRRSWPLMVRTVPSSTLEPGERRTFTRYLARVWRYGDNSSSLNDDVTQFLAEHPEWGPGE